MVDAREVVGDRVHRDERYRFADALPVAYHGQKCDAAVCGRRGPVRDLQEVDDDQRVDPGEDGEQDQAVGVGAVDRVEEGTEYQPGQ